MLFIAGIIIGLLVAAIIGLTVVFLRHPLEKYITRYESRISAAGPQLRGEIIMPDSEEEEIRQEIIEENRQRGRDTPINNLR